MGIDTVEVRKKDGLENISGLIIPGGESTTIMKMMERYSLVHTIKEMHLSGMPIFGTCAGAIVLSKEIIGSDQSSLGLLDITIERNSYGGQLESFETEAQIPELGQPFEAIFIRAPRIKRIGEGLNTLSEYKGDPIMVRDDHALVTTFHPELTEDHRIHEYFIEMVSNQSTKF